MGHRHLFCTSQGFDMDYDQNRNYIHAEHPYLHLGRAGAVENGSLVFPIENMSTSGVNFASQQNQVLRSNEYSNLNLSMEMPHYRPATSGPSYDSILHPSAAGSFLPVHQNYVHHASSSNYYRPTIYGAEDGVVGSTMDSGRGSYKRKTPAISVVCERGITGRYYSAGSSSDLSISSNLQQEKPNLLNQHWPWNPFGTNPSYRGSSLSVGDESLLRNVRSRSTFNLEANLARTHLSSNGPHHPHSTGRMIDHSGMVDFAGLHGNATSREWNFNPVSSTAHGRILASDTVGLSHETNRFLVGGCSTNCSEMGGHHHGFISSSNPVVPPQNLHGALNHTVRRGHGSYSQRAVPAYRANSSYSRLGHVMTSSEGGLQLASETDSSRHSRSLSNLGWRNSDRNGRSRVSYDRFRSLSDQANAHDRLMSEGLAIVDRSTLYGTTRSLLDQHRDMSLDIDSMSYEELLALGERIGNVSTGLSEVLISQCLTETIYCSDQIQEKETCVICLEEYENKEEVGKLKNCRHEYHVACIKKWLSMKNVCPICKAPALADDLKEK